MVPEGWRKCHLRDLLDGGIKNGYSPNAAHNETGYWVLSLGALGEHALVSTEIKPVELTAKVEQAMLQNGDFLVSRSNTPDKVGRSVRFKGEIPNCSYPDLMMRFRIDETEADPDFIEVNLKSAPIRSYYKNSAAGSSSTMIKINKSTVEKTPFLLPPLPEQKKIAKILSTWDKAIATVEKLIANSQQQKKALMQKLLTGEKRLPGFGGEWKYKKISQVAKRIQRKSDGGDYPILTISSLSGFVRQDEKYSRYMAGKSVENYILLKRGEFAYNKGNSKTYEFGCVFDLETYEQGMVPHVYVCFKLNDGLSHRYFKYLFEADYLKPQLGRLVNTGVRNNGLLNIKPAEFLNTKVPVPSYEEQEKIADILHASSLQLQKLESELDALKSEKSALMQQLLTGKRRVLI